MIGEKLAIAERETLRRLKNTPVTQLMRDLTEPLDEDLKKRLFGEEKPTEYYENFVKDLTGE